MAPIRDLPLAHRGVARGKGLLRSHGPRPLRVGSHRRLARIAALGALSRAHPGRRGPRRARRGGRSHALLAARRPGDRHLALPRRIASAPGRFSRDRSTRPTSIRCTACSVPSDGRPSPSCGAESARRAIATPGAARVLPWPDARRRSALIMAVVATAAAVPMALAWWVEGTERALFAHAVALAAAHRARRPRRRLGRAPCRAKPAPAPPPCAPQRRLARRRGPSDRARRPCACWRSAQPPEVDSAR